jgi:hypothetical protein
MIMALPSARAFRLYAHKALGARQVSAAITNAAGRLPVASTHPDCAALVDPLFAFGGKRV